MVKFYSKGFLKQLLKESMIMMIQQIGGLNRELEIIEKPNGNSGVEEIQKMKY